jgi:hypothetical protein
MALTDEQFEQLLGQLDEIQPDDQVARLIAQGASLGFSDEIEALARAPFQSESYIEIRDELRRKINAHRERSPYEAMAYEAAGAMIPTVATMGVSSPLSVVNAARPVVRALQLGAAEGGAAAVGLSEREGVASLKDAPLGVALGTAGGVGGLYAGKFMGGVADKFLEFVRQRGKGRMGTVVENELNRLADQTGMSRDELFERIANGETMSDNQSLHSTVRSYMSQGGPPESMIRTAVPERATTARLAAKEDVQIGLTGGTEGNVLKYANMKETDWKKALGDAYNKVFSKAGEVNPDLTRQALEVVQRVPEALTELNKIYNVRNLVPLFKTADNGALEMSRIPTLEDVEIIRRMANEQAQVAGREGRGTLKSELMVLEDNLRTNIDDFSPELKDTRAGWSRMADARDAFDSGKKAFTGDVEAFEILAEQIMASGDTAKISAFREGIMSSINNKMSTNGSKRFLAKLANPELREGKVFANVFPEDKQKSALVKLALQGKTQLSYEKIIEGPSTALTSAATKQQGLGVGADELLAMSYGNVAAGIGVGMKAIKALAPKLTDSQRRQITEVLLSEDPQFVKSALADSGKMAQLQNRVKKLADMITTGIQSAGGYTGGKAAEFGMRGLLSEVPPESTTQEGAM